MSSDIRVHVGDVGTEFVFEFLDPTAYDPDTDCKPDPLDLTGYTLLEATFERSDGSKVVVPCVLDGVEADGRIKYVTTSGFLSIPGQWRRQARVTLPNGDWRSSIICFTVHPNL